MSVPLLQGLRGWHSDLRPRSNPVLICRHLLNIAPVDPELTSRSVTQSVLITSTQALNALSLASCRLNVAVGAIIVLSIPGVQMRWTR